MLYIYVVSMLLLFKSFGFKKKKMTGPFHAVVETCCTVCRLRQGSLRPVHQQQAQGHPFSPAHQGHSLASFLLSLYSLLGPSLLECEGKTVGGILAQNLV